MEANTANTESLEVPDCGHFAAVYTKSGTFGLQEVEKRSLSPAWKEVMRTKLAPLPAAGYQPGESSH